MPEPTPTPAPTPTPTPTPAPKGRTPSSINQAWAAKIGRAEALCLVALKPANLVLFISHEIAQSYFTELQTLCGQARTLQTAAVVATSEKEGDTALEAKQKAKVFGFMQQAQSWARQKYFFSNYAHLSAYHVGETLDEDFEIMKQFSLDIRDTAVADALPGVDAAWVTNYNAARTAWLGEDTEQHDDEATGVGKRAQLKALVKTIMEKTMTILFCADGIWPHWNPENAGIRKAFDLPADRPYAPPPGEAEVED